MGLFTPTYYCRSLYDIPPEFYEKEGIQVLFCDLDNTLDAFDVDEPSDRAKALVSDLNARGIRLIITSNNHGERVVRYAEALGVTCCYSSRKPLGYRLKRFIRENRLNPDEIAMIGDQLLTDVLAGKNTRVRVILTEPLVNRDLPITRFNRFFDRRIRKIIGKKLKQREVGK